MSEEYWKGYNDFRVGAYNLDSYLCNTKERDDYLDGQKESEYDKSHGFDVRYD